jgi:hypothetical protein
VKRTVGALYKRAWDEQVAPRYRSGEPAPGMSRAAISAAAPISRYSEKKPRSGEVGVSITDNPGFGGRDRQPGEIGLMADDPDINRKNMRPQPVRHFGWAS